MPVSIPTPIPADSAMMFEGAEKRLSLYMGPDTQNLRELPTHFWSQMVACAKAEIRSRISNEHCDAYVLSESSLFVWDDKLLMLTCGNSSLVEAVLFFIHRLGPASLQRLSYHRKNEFFPQQQSSTFEQDVTKLQLALPGTACRLGDTDNHHHHLFHYQAATEAPRLTQPSNVLMMYHIRGDIADFLRSEGQSIQQIRRRLELPQLLTDFELDDWLFEPYGYSMNAIDEQLYVTLHITPQPQSSYVSIDTNLDTSHPLFERLRQLLKPSGWDLLQVNAENPTQAEKAHQGGGYSLPLDDHHRVTFERFQA